MEKERTKRVVDNKKTVSANKKSGKKNKIYIAIILVLIAVSFSIVFLSGIDYEEIYDKQESAASYPVNFTSNDIIDVKSIGSDIFVLTKKLLICLNSRGETEYTLNFTFSDPAINVSNKYGIVFDRMSEKYLVFSRKELVREGSVTAGNYIFTANVNDKAEVLVTTKSNTSASEIILFNSKGKETFAWSCAEEYIISTDMKNDKILCGCIGSFNGDLFTKIYLLDADKKQSIREYTISDSLLTDVSLIGNDAIITCQDKRVIYDTTKKDSAADTVSFSSTAVFFAEDFNCNMAIISNASYSTGEYCLTLYNNNNEIEYSVELDSVIKDVICNDKAVYILGNDSVVQIAKNGTQKTDLIFEENNFGIVKANGSIYCYNMGGVEKAKVN